LLGAEFWKAEISGDPLREFGKRHFENIEHLVLLIGVCGSGLKAERFPADARNRLGSTASAGQSHLLRPGSGIHCVPCIARHAGQQKAEETGML